MPFVNFGKFGTNLGLSLGNLSKCQVIGWPLNGVSKLCQLFQWAENARGKEVKVKGLEPLSSGYGMSHRKERLWVWIQAEETGRFFPFSCCRNWFDVWKERK